MALDESLMRLASETGECILRVYEWSRPTLSLGRNQPARGRYDTARARELGVDIVRRLTGGRAVLHHREVTYSIAAPAIALGSPPESYSWINRLLLDALRRLGVGARVAEPGTAAPRPSLAPCFESPVAGEIVSEIEGQARKLIGSAQYRERDSLLQHGSILVDNDQDLATMLLARSADVLPLPVPATLHGLLGRVPVADEVFAALRSALADATGGQAAVLPFDGPLRVSALDENRRYSQDAWTWRL
ncbi:MAG: biotin/lipoate A/B protein ligase family protein [Gemmatimonadaceae bacterium]